MQRNLKNGEKLHPHVFEQAIKNGYAKRYAERIAPDDEKMQQEIFASFV